MSYLARDVFPGGCFVTAASCEFDDRPGRVREAIRAQHREWLRVLAREAQAGDRRRRPAARHRAPTTSRSR